MTPEAQLALIATIPGFLAFIVGIATLYHKVDTVKTIAVEAKQTGVATHILVNSQRSEVLLALSTQLRRIADLTKAGVDIKAAEVALESYNEHQKQQAVVNANAGGSTPPKGRL